MSRRDASSAGTVSLFPFLAVLVCAMGALILLLLVTTRRIRQRALATEVIVVPVDDESLRVPTPPSPAPLPTMAAIPDPADDPIMPLLAADPPPPMPRPFDPTPALLQKLAELEKEQATLAADVAMRQQQISELGQSSSQERQKLSELAETKTALDAEKERLSNLYARLREQEADTEKRADELRQRIQHARVQAADADSKFAVVPYDGDSGTTRRPIIIECTADRFTFASEGVSLAATDLNGFTPRYNPLLYVTHALVRYWERRDRTSTDSMGEPYLMLVVRPGGTTGYYVARGLLSELNEPFGYELVTDDQQFAWPPSDLEAITICKTIINKMLRERDELMQHALHGGANLTDFSNAQGEFRLEEIDRLQNPTREVTINGQHFSREPQRGNSRSGGEDAFSRYNDPPSGRDSRGGTGRSDRSENNLGLFGEAGDASTSDAADGRTVHAYNDPAATTNPDSAALVPDWLRDGAARMAPSSRRGETVGVSEVDPFGEVEGGTSSPPGTLSPPMVAGIDESLANGRSGTFDESATRTGSPADPNAPQSQDMITFTPSGKRGEVPVNPIRPQWGIRTAGGTIGYERDVRVVVSANQISIGERNGFQFDGKMPLNDLRRLLAASVDREVRSWGTPPKSFYWVPSIHFVVSPDGRAAQERLRTIVQSWDLRSTAEYTKE